MNRKYQNPPIVEALCEFQFEPCLPWDLTVPGLVYEKVQNEFPKKRLAKTFAIGVEIGPERVQQQLLTTDRMQFLQEDEKTLIQIDQNLLVINRLKPYPTWEAFQPQVRTGFEAYRTVADPKGIQRMGLRYINQISLPGPPPKIEDYFEFRPFVGPNLPQAFGAFAVAIQIPYEEARDVLRLQLTRAVVEMSDTLSVTLDLNYEMAQPDRVPLDDVFAWLDTAHRHVEAVFEASITERLRETFT